MLFRADVSAGLDVWRRGAALAALAALCASGCSRTVRARVLDTAGRPLAGALFYAESHRPPGAFDFALAQTGPDGTAGPLTLRWHPGAYLAVAAFAPGKQPEVLYEPGNRLDAGEIVFKLEGATPSGPRWNYRVANLGYPFEDNPELAARLAAPALTTLRRFMREAYAPLAAGGVPGTPAELDKLKAVRRLGP